MGHEMGNGLVETCSSHLQRRYTFYCATPF